MISFKAIEVADAVAVLLCGTEGVWETQGDGTRFGRSEVKVRDWNAYDACMVSELASDGHMSARPLTFAEVVVATMRVLELED